MGDIKVTGEHFTVQPTCVAETVIDEDEDSQPGDFEARAWEHCRQVAHDNFERQRESEELRGIQDRVRWYYVGDEELDPEPRRSRSGVFPRVEGVRCPTCGKEATGLKPALAFGWAGVVALYTLVAITIALAFGWQPTWAAAHKTEALCLLTGFGAVLFTLRVGPAVCGSCRWRAL